MRRKSDLHYYQQRAVTELFEHTERLAIIPMGGGKTVAALTAVQELLDAGEIRAAVVLAPKRVASEVWPAELREWAHLAGLRMVVVAGTAARRAKALREPADIYVVGIDNTQWLTDQMETWADNDPRFDLLVIDELSRYKKPNGKRGRALSLIADKFKNRWGLTGTPRPNSEMDFFQPARILTRRRIWDCLFEDWKLENFKPDQIYNIQAAKWTVREAAKEAIWASVADFSFTVDAAELPPQPELVPIEHWVDLPPDARTAFDEMVRHHIYEGNLEDIIAENAGVASGKLEQIAQGFIYRDGETLEILHEAKKQKLADLIEGLGGQQALITYWFKEDLAAIRSLLGDMCPVLGSTTSAARARDYIDRWNAGDLQLLPLHPASAGHGLNLQKSSAGQIIHYCPTWSPELFDQVNARLARQGNKRDRVFNHLILARGTLDEVKLTRVAEKQGEQEAFRRFVARYPR